MVALCFSSFAPGDVVACFSDVDLEFSCSASMIDVNLRSLTRRDDQKQSEGERDMARRGTGVSSVAVTAWKFWPLWEGRCDSPVYPSQSPPARTRCAAEATRSMNRGDLACHPEHPRHFSSGKGLGNRFSNPEVWDYLPNGREYSRIKTRRRSLAVRSSPTHVAAITQISVYSIYCWWQS